MAADKRCARRDTNMAYRDDTRQMIDASLERQCPYVEATAGTNLRTGLERSIFA